MALEITENGGASLHRRNSERSEFPSVKQFGNCLIEILLKFGVVAGRCHAMSPGDEEIPFPNGLTETIKCFAGSMARPDPKKPSLRMWLPV